MSWYVGVLLLAAQLPTAFGQSNSRNCIVNTGFNCPCNGYGSANCRNDLCTCESRACAGADSVCRRNQQYQEVGRYRIRNARWPDFELSFRQDGKAFAEEKMGQADRDWILMRVPPTNRPNYMLLSRKLNEAALGVTEESICRYFLNSTNGTNLSWEEGLEFEELEEVSDDEDLDLDSLEAWINGDGVSGDDDELDWPEEGNFSDNNETGNSTLNPNVSAYYEYNPDRRRSYYNGNDNYGQPERRRGYYSSFTPGRRRGYNSGFTPDRRRQGYNGFTPDRRRGYNDFTPDRRRGYNGFTPDRRRQGYNGFTPDRRREYTTSLHRRRDDTLAHRRRTTYTARRRRTRTICRPEPRPRAVAMGGMPQSVREMTLLLRKAPITSNWNGRDLVMISGTAHPNNYIYLPSNTQNAKAEPEDYGAGTYWFFDPPLPSYVFRGLERFQGQTCKFACGRLFGNDMRFVGATTRSSSPALAVLFLLGGLAAAMRFE